MHVTLRANGFITNLSGGISDDPIQQMRCNNNLAIFFPTDVHGNGIEFLGTLCFRVPETPANIIQTTDLDHGAESVWTVNETQRIGDGGNIQARAKSFAHLQVLTKALMVAQILPTAGPLGSIVKLPTAAGTINVSA